jgi:anti-sigma factor RsiW
VELVSDYLEGALTAGERERFEAHLDGCDACTRYLKQMRLTIEMLGKLTEESIDSEARDTLLGIFRDWKGQEPVGANSPG